jgi:hypothetical protein
MKSILDKGGGGIGYARCDCIFNHQALRIFATGKVLQKITRVAR